MFLMILFLLAVHGEPPAGDGAIPPAVLEDGSSVQWMALPKAGLIEGCIKKNSPRGPAARLKVQCTSAADDRVENCSVIESSAPGNSGVDAAAICATQYFRVRTRDPSGAVVTGVTVKLPLAIGR
jgi:hypothetical protein